MIDYLDKTLNDPGLTITRLAKQHDAQVFYRLRSVPGIGKILAASCHLVLRRPSDTEAHPDIHVAGIDQVAKSGGVDLAARVQFHVPHALATSLQQISGIIEHCAVEEADVDMTLE